MSPRLGLRSRILALTMPVVLLVSAAIAGIVYLSLGQVLEASARHVVADSRQVTGFDLSGGSVAERTVWNVRRQINGVTLVGGSWLARVIAKAVCVVLGISCDFAKSA